MATRDSAERVRAAVLAAIAEIAPDADVAALEPERSFHDQIGMDSVDFLNFVLALERSLGLRIAETDYPLVSSLSGCIAYLAPRVADN